WLHGTEPPTSMRGIALLLREGRESHASGAGRGRSASRGGAGWTTGGAAYTYPRPGNAMLVLPRAAAPTRRVTALRSQPPPTRPVQEPRMRRVHQVVLCLALASSTAAASSRPSTSVPPVNQPVTGPEAALERYVEAFRDRSPDGIAAV